MKYTVRFYNDVTGEIFTVMEFENSRFTKRQYDIIVSCLFETAAEGIDNRSLFADVFFGVSASQLNDLSGVMGDLTIACETTVDGAEIWAHIFANSRHVRNMCIAC